MADLTALSTLGVPSTTAGHINLSRVGRLRPESAAGIEENMPSEEVDMLGWSTTDHQIEAIQKTGDLYKLINGTEYQQLMQAEKRSFMDST